MHLVEFFGRYEVHIGISRSGNTIGWFDLKKLERVLYNLLRNACEVVPRGSGRIEVELAGKPAGVQIRVRDNGAGIPGPIHDRLFESFVCYGKENGSGMGLAVAQKIIQDHSGEISVERTSEAGTTFKLTMPLALAHPVHSSPQSSLAIFPTSVEARTSPLFESSCSSKSP